MSPKEKALELFIKYRPYTKRDIFDKDLKDCSLILVDEILSTLYKDYYDINNGVYEFWEDVKKEIENM